MHKHILHAALNQFTKTLDKNQAETLFKLLLKYRPETKTEKRERLLAEAEARADNKVTLPVFKNFECAAPRFHWVRLSLASRLDSSGAMPGNVHAQWHLP